MINVLCVKAVPRGLQRKNNAFLRCLYVAEREGFEPKRRLGGKRLNTAKKIANTIRCRIHVNTRKIAGKISN